MLKVLLIGLLQIALGLGNGPTMEWKQSVEPADGADWTLVLEGKITGGFYVHTMENKAIGVTLEIEPAAGLLLVGEPEEEFTPTDYKGETVATGTYILRQKFNYTGSRPLTLQGEVGWSACEGDACRQPEYLAFQCPVGAGSGGAAEESAGAESLWALLLEAILWGFLMLLTPCVFPMVPMTVSFFLKGSGSAAAGRFKALMYGLFIVLLYTVPISIIIGLTWVLGGSAVTADIFNWLSTHWLPNILFFLVFMAFAASFFGAFEIVLPARWTNSADRNSDRAGLAGVFFLALTLVLVSFSCTGPIVGTVLIKSTRGEFWTPMLAMLAFSVAFALPFTLLAFFPSVLKKLPKSGGWLNSVKVVLGFIEIALGLKFLSVADQTYHWHLLDREVYLAIWIAVFFLLGLYLIGKIRFKHDTPLEYLSVPRLALSIAVFAFVVYLVPGMWGAPLKAISGYLPPMETQDFVLAPGATGQARNAAVPDEALPDGMIRVAHGLPAYERLDDGLAAARESGKPVFLDFTGYGCVNCREMESRVWSDPEVLRRLRDDFVIVALHVDDKTRLPESEWVLNENGKPLKDVGRVNSYIALHDFGVNAQPNYFLLNGDGSRIAGPRPYNLDIQGFIDFLDQAL
jgi:thiol:disulfide interchange protein DsbD